MTNSTKRQILRAIHLIVTIPILGYIYGEPSEVRQYAKAVRLIFVPLIILSGYWMYSGVLFAVVGVALWIGAIRLSGFGAAVLSQVALFFLWKIFSAVRGRRLKILPEKYQVLEDTE